MEDQFIERLRRLAASDKLDQIVSELLIASESIDKDYRKQVIHQSAQLNHWKVLRLQGTEDYDTLARVRNRVSIGILDLIDLFPTTSSREDKIKSKIGVSEFKLKVLLLTLFFISKLSVLFFSYSLWQAGAFSVDQIISISSTLIILSGVFLSAIINQYFNPKNILKRNDIRVSKHYSIVTTGIMIFYPLIVSSLLISGAKGQIRYSELNILLGVIETIFAIYLGRILFNQA